MLTPEITTQMLYYYGSDPRYYSIRCSKMPRDYLSRPGGEAVAIQNAVAVGGRALLLRRVIVRRVGIVSARGSEAGSYLRLCITQL